MRKVLIGLLAALLLLAGCSRPEITANADEIVVALNLSDITDDIYSAAISYYLDDELIGSAACAHADETPYNEPKAVFSLTPLDLPEGADLDKFSFHASVSFEKDGTGDVSAAEKTLSTDNCKPFEAAYGNIYRFILTGSRTEGLELTADK